MAALSFPDLNPDDTRLAELTFEYVQFLLDDDTNLTPTGNLTGAARLKCRARLEEIVSGQESAGLAASEPAVAEATVAEPAGAP